MRKCENAGTAEHEGTVLTRIVCQLLEPGDTFTNGIRAQAVGGLF